MDGDPGNPAVGVFDSHELVARCLGNLELAERVLAKFRSRFVEDLAELEQAALAEDASHVAIVAHRLKGSSASTAAHALCERAAEIETLARRNAIAEIPSRLHGLRSEWARFVEKAAPPGLFARHGQ
ncbi:MAG: Hpt domain-containing protein [Pirellulales bacterium]|nr:Hpt domain-containing protein [Pirellulales bacterium]